MAWSGSCFGWTKTWWIGRDSIPQTHTRCSAGICRRCFNELSRPCLARERNEFRRSWSSPTTSPRPSPPSRLEQYSRTTCSSHRPSSSPPLCPVHRLPPRSPFRFVQRPRFRLQRSSPMVEASRASAARSTVRWPPPTALTCSARSLSGTASACSELHSRPHRSWRPTAHHHHYLHGSHRTASPRPSR